MDAKSKANFINSVGSVEMVNCPACGSANKANRSVCFLCGAPMHATEGAETSKQEFASIDQNSQEAPAVVQKPYVEPSCAFAEGLPDWSIEPPQLGVRRR